MKFGEGDLGAELYVATQGHQNKQEHIDSLTALAFVKRYNLAKVIEIIPVNDLDGLRDYFDITRDPAKETKLPFLVCAHTCQTSAVLGYSGLDEVLNELKGPMFAIHRKE